MGHVDSLSTSNNGTGDNLREGSKLAREPNRPLHPEPRWRNVKRQRNLYIISFYRTRSRDQKNIFTLYTVMSKLNTINNENGNPLK